MSKIKKIFTVFLALLLTLSTIFYNNVSSLFANDTLKVDLKIINIENDTYNEDREFWVDTPIGAAADITVSGKGAKLVEPWAVLTVSKSQYLAANPTFVDSQNAYETLREETADNYIITYKFKEIAGGSRFTFPFPFKFKLETPNQTQLPINFKIVDGSKDDKPVLYNYDTAYIAKRQEFDRRIAGSAFYNPRSGGTHWAFDASKDIPNPNQVITTKLDSDLYNDVVTVASGQTTTGPTPLEYHVYPGVNTSYPKGTTGTISYVPIEKLVVKYTLPEGVTPTDKTLAGDNNFKAEWDPATRVLTQTDSNPDRYARHNWVWFNSFPARTAGVALNFTDIPFGVEKKIKVEITQKNRGEAEFTYQPLSHSIVFKSREFTPTSEFYVYKDNYNAWASLYLDESKTPYISEGTYTYVKPGPTGRFYADKTDMTEQGMNYVVYLSNRHNQANNPDTTAKPITSSVFKITDILEKEGTTKMAYRSIKVSNRFNSEETKRQFNELSKVLYGVLANGTREEIKRDFKTGDIVETNDKTGKYRKLEIEFPQPIILNNTTLRYDIATELLPDEWKKFEDGTYTERQIYRGSVEADATTAIDSETKENEKVHSSDRYNGHHATTSMWKLTPQSSLRVENFNPTVPFSAAGSKFTLKYTIDTNQRGFGPTSLEDSKLTVLLPTGYEYNGNLRLGGVVKEENPNIKPEIIENYKNTGKTALIFPLSTLTPSEEKNFNQIIFDGLVTKTANRGNSTVEAYLTYANNDVVTPPGNQVYKDAYDLDNDGNRDENFIFSNTAINYIPPLELSSKKLVGYNDVDLKLLATGDLGYQFVYELSIFNNTIDTIRNAHLIDTLPYVGDHSITANQAGVYLPRESKFSTPLARALEDEPKNAMLLDRFDFFYQLEDAGATLESVRDGRWIKKDAVTDFSKVKSIKISLKEGKEIRSREEVKFYISANIPFNKLLEVGTYAVNSVAVSTDGVIYAEANKVQTTFAKYAVDGVVFKDYNKDNQFNTSESKIANQVVELIDVATGNVAVDPEGNAIVGETDSEGKYHFDVYRRGEYQVRFKEIADAPFTGYNQTNTGNHVDQTRDGYGYTKKFELNPTITSVKANAGYVVEKREIIVTKVDAQVGADGSKKGLKGATFELRNEAGDQVLQTVTSDDNGKVIFKDVLFGRYKVAEVDAPIGYILNEMVFDVTVTADAEATLEVSNQIKKGNVKVIKVDAEDATKKLDGVTFELRQNGVKVAEGVTANGEYTFNNVVYGDYQLVETATLENYNLNTTSVEVLVRENGVTIETTVSNQIKKGNVKVIKVDAEDATKKLDGVTFELRQNGVKVAEGVTANGEYTFNNVVYGDYQLVETATLENYNLNTTPVEVLVRENGVTIEKTVSNQIKKGNVKVIKVDAEDATKKLGGVTFELRQNGVKVAEGVTANGEYTFNNVVYGDYQLVETATLENYNLNTTPVEVLVRENGVTIETTVSNQIKKGNVKVIKVDAEDATKKLDGVTFELRQNGVKVAEGVTANGEYTFNNVVYGDYQLVETATLENYNLNTTPVEVLVRENSVTIEKTVSNQIKKGNVKVIKVDAEDATKKLDGVTFELRQNGVKVAEGVTANGEYTFNNVVYGDYQLVETATLENYNLNTTPVEVLVRENGVTIEKTVSNQIKKGNVKVIKVDAEDATKKLDGVTFELRQNGVKVAEGVTANGEYTFNNVVYGDYQLVETATLENYNLNTTPVEVLVRENGVTIEKTVSNQIKKGNVKVIKVDAEDATKKLGGVTFELRQNGVMKYTAVTNQDGIALFEGVIYGGYELVEAKTLENYILSHEKYGVVVAEHGTTVDLGEYPNHKIYGNVVLHKIDTETRLPLSRVEFTLTKADGTTMVAESDANGKVIFERLEYGSYTIQETKAKEGYVSNSAIYAAVIQEDGKVVDLGYVENQLIRGSVVLHKIDTETRLPLSGVEFTLTKADGTTMVAESDADGKVIFERLEYGIYTIQETKAKEGYVSNSDIYAAVIQKDEEVVDLGYIENQLIRGNVVLQKTDADTKLPLAGVTFALLEVGTGKVVQEQVSDKEGIVIFSGVPYGVYELIESKALEGYKNPDERYAVAVLKDGKVVDLGIISNESIRGSIYVHKVDSTTKENLSGVEFTLYRSQEVVAQATTDANGELRFEGLVYGKYTVKETKALEGYHLDTKSYDVMIKKDGEVVPLVVENIKVLKPTVDTSDNRFPYELGLLFAIFGIFFLGRKNKN